MLISIIVPVYNIEAYIERCLLSIVQQDFPSEQYEIILVNDGSTDGSLMKIENTRKNYPDRNIKIYTKENGGQSSARNFGIDKASAEYIWFIDGIDGFCYYHYWFGEGRQLLQLPLEEMMKLNEPDFPFMLCWANESWHSKFWNLDGTVDKKVLIEQKYGGTEEYKKHFDYVLKAFKDERYIKIDEKPAFMIYLPNDFDNLSFFIDYWQGLAKENGLKGIFFIAHTTLADDETQGLLEMGFDGVNTNRLRDVLTKRPKFKRLLGRLHRNLMKTPIVVDYVGATKFLLTPLENKNDVFPTIYPNWDHTPRSGKAGLVLQNSSPNKFKNHLRAVFKVLKNKPPHRQLCFIKSWNEWGEGNYLEPDLKFGKKYLEIFCEVKNEFND